MAETSSSSSRIRVAVRLFLLLGLPFLVVMTIFGGGVYCGASNSARVVSIEDRVFALFGSKPAETADDPKGEDGSKDDEDEDEKKPTKEKKAEGEDDEGEEGAEPTKTPEPVVKEVVKTTVLPILTPFPTPVPGETPPEPAPGEVPIEVAVPEPVDDGLESKLERPKVVTVKVLVDPEIIAAQPQWIDYVNGLVRTASANYETWFGVEFRLYGVVEWNVPIRGVDHAALMKNLGDHELEGADLLIAVSNRPHDEAAVERGPAAAQHNRPRVILYADKKAEHPHLRSILREVGWAMGGDVVSDRESAAFKRGSWMSPVGGTSGEAPWIDNDNRRKILERKDLPFTAAAGGSGGEQ